MVKKITKKNWDKIFAKMSKNVKQMRSKTGDGYRLYVMRCFRYYEKEMARLEIAH